ncbi:MAG: hypothetical protein OXH75_15210 [Acidobacteria bacterium]|nr:hypothetical protein [Acidobacteriota bacterium]
MALTGLALPAGVGLISIRPLIYNPARYRPELPGGGSQLVKKAADRWRFEVRFGASDTGELGAFLDRLESTGEAVQIPLRELPVPGDGTWTVTATAHAGKLSRVTVTARSGVASPVFPQWVAIGPSAGTATRARQRTFRVAASSGPVLDLFPRVDIPAAWTRLVAAAAVDCFLVPGSGDWGLRTRGRFQRGRAVFEELL